MLQRCISRIDVLKRGPVIKILGGRCSDPADTADELVALYGLDRGGIHTRVVSSYTSGVAAVLPGPLVPEEQILGVEGPAGQDRLVAHLMPGDPIGGGHRVDRRFFPASDYLESLEPLVLFRVRVGVDVCDTRVGGEQIVLPRALELFLAQERLGPVDAVLALGIGLSVVVDTSDPDDSGVFALVPHAVLLAIEGRRETTDVSLLPRIFLFNHRLSPVRAVEDPGHACGLVEPEVVNK